MPARYLTTKETAELLRCSSHHIRRAVKTGRLKKIKLSSRFVRFREADVIAYMEGQVSK